MMEAVKEFMDTEITVLQCVCVMASFIFAIFVVYFCIPFISFLRKERIKRKRDKE